MADSQTTRDSQRERLLLILVWVVLAALSVLVARQNFSVPGLYYDEALFGGLAKDFVTGQPHLHMPGAKAVNFLGRPFPIYASVYNGALKSWVLIPFFTLFGSSVAVLRVSGLLVALVAALFLMLSVRRLLGLGAAIVTGAILIVDPTFFFLGLFDWGVSTNSLFCRCGAFFLALIWWRNRKLRYLFFAAFLLGLGVFNKVDFVAFLAAIAISGVCFYGAQLWPVVRARLAILWVCCAGFLLGALPMILNIRRLLRDVFGGQAGADPGEKSEKFHTILSMYDGSYFYRLMDVGGLFSNMYAHPAGVQSFFGLFVVLAIAVLFAILFSKRDKNDARMAAFLLLGFALTTVFAFFIPSAVRLHHAVQVYPLPQLIIAAAFGFLWKAKWRPGIQRFAQVALLVSILALVGSQARAIHTTETLISSTGGRGLWSAAFDDFCRENKNRSDLVMVSLDWGFNEQLAFLTDAQLVEPFWDFRDPLQPLPQNPENVYLAHAVEYSVFGADIAYLNKLQMRARNAEIQSFSNREGRIIFYSIRFRSQ